MLFKAFKQIYRPEKLKKLAEKELHTRDTGGKELGYKGYLPSPNATPWSKVMQDLVVLEQVQEDIVGINFIRQHALSYNSLMNQCFWETLRINSGQLRAVERTHIDV
jgi:hypothetical protein